MGRSRHPKRADDQVNRESANGLIIIAKDMKVNLSAGKLTEGISTNLGRREADGDRTSFSFQHGGQGELLR